MTNPSRGRGGSGRDPDAGAPRWVKVFVIFALVLLLLFVVLQFVGGGHGPGRHAGDAGEHAPFARSS